MLFNFLLFSQLESWILSCSRRSMLIPYDSQSLRLHGSRFFAVTDWWLVVGSSWFGDSWRICVFCRRKLRTCMWTHQLTSSSFDDQLRRLRQIYILLTIKIRTLQDAEQQLRKYSLHKKDSILIWIMIHYYIHWIAHTLLHSTSVFSSYVERFSRKSIFLIEKPYDPSGRPSDPSGSPAEPPGRPWTPPNGPQTPWMDSKWINKVL